MPAELRDAMGNLRLPLVSAGTRVCVVEPASLQEAAACDGIDLQTAQKQVPKSEAPITVVAFAIVRTEANARAALTIVRGEDEHSTAFDRPRADSAVRNFVAGLPKSMPPPNRVLGGDDHAQFVKLGSVEGARGFAHLELASAGQPPRRIDMLFDIVPSYGQGYTLTLLYAPEDQQAVVRFEDDILSHGSVDAPPDTPPMSPAYAFGYYTGLIVFPVALAFAVAVGLVLRGARRRAPQAPPSNETTPRR